MHVVLVDLSDYIASITERVNEYAPQKYPSFPGLAQVQASDNIMAFAGFTLVANRQTGYTDRQTQHATACVAVDRILCDAA